MIEDFASAVPVAEIGNLLDMPQGDKAPLRGWPVAILGTVERNSSGIYGLYSYREIFEFNEFRGRGLGRNFT